MVGVVYLPYLVRPRGHWTGATHVGYARHVLNLRCLVSPYRIRRGRAIHPDEPPCTKPVDPIAAVERGETWIRVDMCHQDIHLFPRNHQKGAHFDSATYRIYWHVNTQLMIMCCTDRLVAQSIPENQRRAIIIISSTTRITRT